MLIFILQKPSKVEVTIDNRIGTRIVKALAPQGPEIRRRKTDFSLKKRGRVSGRKLKLVKGPLCL